MILKADYEAKTVFEINYDRLKEEGITAIAFDLDSTVMKSKSGTFSQETLQLFDRLKQDFRLFKCSRITSINLCDVEFNRIPIKIEDKPWLTNQPLGNKITLELKVNSLTLPEIYDWAKDVKICKQTANYAIVKSSALLNDGLISRLINYGNSIKVISPSSVISKIVELCKRITNEYLLN